MPHQSFSIFHLPERLLNALSQLHFLAPTPIQSSLIPEMLMGKSLIACAPPGSGKTLMYIIPALSLLSQSSTLRAKGPRILILVPTRELAKQVECVLKQFMRFVRFRAITLTGGTPIETQAPLFRHHYDILIATPGRLKRWILADKIEFNRLQMVVMDEADRLLNCDFYDNLKEFLPRFPKEFQIILSSATISDHTLFLNQCLFYRDLPLHCITENAVAIREAVYSADDLYHKKALLQHHLTFPDLKQTIVFTATKKSANHLQKHLKNLGVSCQAFHSDLYQTKRNEIISHMQNGLGRILIATDLAARGLDLQNVSHILNFDLPHAPEDYIHRIGRAGRSCGDGTAISLVTPHDRPRLAAIEEFTGYKIQRTIVPGLEPKLPWDEE